MTTLLYIGIAIVWLRIIGGAWRTFAVACEQLHPSEPQPAKVRPVYLGFHPGCFHVGAGGELWSCVKSMPAPAWHVEYAGLIDQRATYLNLKLHLIWWTLSIQIRVTKWRAA